MNVIFFSTVVFMQVACCSSAVCFSPAIMLVHRRSKITLEKERVRLDGRNHKTSPSSGALRGVWRPADEAAAHSAGVSVHRRQCGHRVRGHQRAIEDMVERTSTLGGPWHVIPANDKKYARLACIRIMTEILAARVDLRPPPLDERAVDEARAVLGLDPHALDDTTPTLAAGQVYPYSSRPGLGHADGRKGGGSRHTDARRAPAGPV